MNRKLIWAAIAAVFAASSAIYAPSRAEGVPATLEIVPQNTPPAPCAPGTTITMVGNDKVCGLAPSASVYAYEGIRYANSARWQAPAKAPWPVKLDATAFGSICPQTKINPNTDKPVVIGAEDCLFLNVWAPQGAIGGKEKLPVMVFIHGGAFVSGSGSVPLFDGTQLASQGVVIVTLNYRLGALGFLAGDTLNNGNLIGGNFGLMDQRMALQWVHDNIAPFGGDASNVTIFGESAGAMSVALHHFDIRSDVSDNPVDAGAPLFQKTIVESNPAGVIYRPQDKAIPQGNLYLDKLCKDIGGNPVAGLKIKTPYLHDATWLTDNKHLTLDTIVFDQSDFHSKNIFVDLIDLLTGVFGAQSLPWQPVVDNSLVFGEPYAGYASGVKPKPVAVGTNLDEGALFVGAAYKPSRFTALTYRLLVSHVYKGKYEDFIKNDRYNPDKQYIRPEDSGYENKYSAAFTNIMTDYVFVCGNISSLNNALGQSASTPVYYYQFTQKPFFDLYDLAGTLPPPSNGACQPDSLNVCHGNELAYVFNTLPAVSSYFKPPAGGGDAQLAGRMYVAWAAFAKGQTTPSDGWVQYARGGAGPAALWNANAPTGTVANVDTPASCTSTWLNQKPYAP
jgi:carboxylesterase type B